MAKRFGTDGVRGVANRDLTPELAFALGRQGAAVLLAHRTGARRPFVVVGRDTRRSGEMLQAALAAGLCSQGVDTWLAGVVTTPGVAWLTRHTGALAGIVISASHNPPADNGIKFFGADGYKLPDAVEADIDGGIDRALAGGDGERRPEGGDVGRIGHREDLVMKYQDYLLSLVKEPLSGLRVAVDPGNGAASALGPRVLREAEVDVDAIHDSPDGVNINVGCGSTDMTTLRELVRRGGFDAGLAFDGDADRLLALDERGEPVDGDRLLYICCTVLPELRDEPAVVATVMSNLGFEQALKRRGVALHRAAVGDRYVLEMMRAEGCKLGGEQSGHIIFADLATTGDGLITALELLRALRLSGRPLSELAAEVPSFPQVLLNVRVGRRDGWDADPEVSAAIARAEADMAGRGRVLVRPSGTEMLIRVMVEGEDAGEVQAVAQGLADVVAARLGQPAAAAS